MTTMIGVIGGSGLYEIDGLEDAAWQSVESPWGAPSDQILTGRLDGVAMAFLPRHGRGHTHSPTTVPYRANIDALKRLGVTDVVSVSACGSFCEEMAPGDFVVVDQFIDRTFAREKKLLWNRTGWTCQRRAPHMSETWRSVFRSRPGVGRNHARRGHISGNGRPAIFVGCGIAYVSVMGL